MGIPYHWWVVRGFSSARFNHGKGHAILLLLCNAVSKWQPSCVAQVEHVLWGRKCFGIGHLGPTYSSQHEAQQHQCQENSCRYTRRHEVALQFTSILQLIAATSDVFRDQCSVHVGGHLESPPTPFEHESTQSTSQSLRKRLCQATTPRYCQQSHNCSRTFLDSQQIAFP